MHIIIQATPRVSVKEGCCWNSTSAFTIYSIIQSDNLMADIQKELQAVQEQLRKYAEQLGQLNLSNNELMESNEKLSAQIITINNKINKKKHQIQQENKDKLIIHQKLVKSEKVKEEVEIKFSNIRSQKENERKHKEQLERQKQEQERHKEEERVKKEQERQKAEESKVAPVKQVTKQEKQEQLVKQSIQEQKVQPKKTEQKIEPASKAPIPNFYDNSQKGEYRPPALFLDDQSQEQDDEQDNKKTIEILRSKLRLQSKQLREDEEDD